MTSKNIKVGELDDRTLAAIRASEPRLRKHRNRDSLRALAARLDAGEQRIVAVMEFEAGAYRDPALHKDG